MKYSMNIKMQITKMVAEKRSIIETLKQNKILTYAEVTKEWYGNIINNDEKNASNMSDSVHTTENKDIATTTNQMKSKLNNNISLTNSESNESQWPKEFVINRINKLNEELKK